MSGNTDPNLTPLTTAPGEKKYTSEAEVVIKTHNLINLMMVIGGTRNLSWTFNHTAKIILGNVLSLNNLINCATLGVCSEFCNNVSSAIVLPIAFVYTLWQTRSSFSISILFKTDYIQKGPSLFLESLIFF